MWRNIRPFVAMVITAGLSIIAGYTIYVLKRRSRDDKKADEICSLDEKETSYISNKVVDKKVVGDDDAVKDDNKQQQQYQEHKQNASVKTTRIDDHNKKRVLVLGVEKAGKTTFIASMSNQQSSEKYTPTQGFSVVTTSIGEKAINFWEVGGAPNLRPHWGRYIDGTNLLLYVIDSTDANIVHLAKDELTDLVKANQYLDTIPWLIIASKQDLLGAMSPDEIRELLNIPQVPKQPEKIVIGMELPAKGLKKGISKVKSFLTETAF